MSEIDWKPDPSLEDNDDDHRASKKQKKKAESRCVSTRRYTRVPFKIIAALATVYVSILSSERYFYYWVQTSIERTDMHVSEIDFPAVTIIPINFTSVNISKKSQRFSKAYNLIQSVIWQTPMSARLMEENFTEFSDYDNWNFQTWGILESWQFNCKHFFTECQWRRKPMNCCEIFRPGRTFNGFAFEFNSNLSSGRDETWPWSVAASGAYSGLNVKIKRQYTQFTINTLGVIVHEPTQYLGVSIDYSSEDRIVIPVEPLRFTAEIDVRARPVNMRRCFFENEVILLNQSRSECIYKCHINYIFIKCNCSLELPEGYTFNNENITDAKGSSGRRICGVKDLYCFNKHKLSLFSMSNIIEESRDNVFTTVDCGCFPQCDHTQYHTSTYTERLSTPTAHDEEIEIDVYFQEETLFSYRSMLRFTLIDLMVSYGGIAGLIMGISVLGFFNNFLDHFACCRLPHNS
ncbi:pickpocket protein 28 [Drosophila subpulchrella]|uniref:pickpocket protein 28 n=1 Tax=Drosophila subpulchrella TaxID=1486046 RepID=UPI0018A154AA|nr:pickpocket protein 28 [Drosophila subpulchrella]